MDFSTIIGVILALGGIGAGYMLEGGSFGALLALSPILIIFGGTIGVVIITQPFEVSKNFPKLIIKLFTNQKYDYLGIIDDCANWSRVARANGIIELDKIVQEIKDPFIARGLQYVVDSIEPEQVKHFLETELDAMTARHAKNASMFEAAGGFAPTMGIIGTVLGLIVILSGLATASIGELGHGIATAFLATFMGVGVANLICLPFKDKLKNKSKQELLYREIAMNGILAIQAQESPNVIKKRLLSQLPDYMKNKAKEE
jgi:chemotaxis protein MotA